MDVLLLCEVLLALLLLAATAANTLVLIVFYRRPALRNRFVINLVCSNLASPLALLDALDSPAGEAVAASVCVTSVFAVLLVTLDQYCAVVDPLRYHARISKARSAALIFGAWFLTLLLGSLQALGRWTDHRVAAAAVLFTLGFLLPFAAILWMYVCIYAAAHSNLQRTRTGGAATPSSSTALGSLKNRISNASLFRYREETRAARISALVIVMALTCWLPYVTVLGSRALTQVPCYLQRLGLALLLSSSLVSTCLFAFRNRRIQRETRRLFGRSSDRERRIRRLAPQQQTLLEDTRRISFLSNKVIVPESALTVDTGRSSFSSGGSSSTQGTSSSVETDGER